MLVLRKLIIDDRNEIFDSNGMTFREFPSDFMEVRDYAAEILKDCPEQFREGGLLEQQLSEVIKNGVKHGNRSDPSKMIRIWYDLRKRVRFVVEDEGDGFVNMEDWNEFFARRQTALYNNDFDTFLSLASYRGPHSDHTDGGSSLIAALEYWNGGMIYNQKRNKVGVIRWFASGSSV